MLTQIEIAGNPTYQHTAKVYKLRSAISCLVFSPAELTALCRNKEIKTAVEFSKYIYIPFTDQTFQKQLYILVILSRSYNYKEKAKQKTTHNQTTNQKNKPLNSHPPYFVK